MPIQPAVQSTDVEVWRSVLPHSGKTRVVTDLATIQSLCSSGVLQHWGTLVSKDPAATFFQHPSWCMSWYEAYANDFAPKLIYVTDDSNLVGLVPLATETRTGRITFAGDNMADYRDVVAAPGWRTAVLSEVLRLYSETSQKFLLRLGPMDPASESASILEEIAGRYRLQTSTSFHPCWRRHLHRDSADNDVLKKKYVRRHLNHYERRGEVVLHRVTSAEWPSFREEFFQWHTLRQMHVGRTPSFNEPRKKQFHDRLIIDHSQFVHVTRLTSDNRFLAGHFGFVQNGVLYWGAPTFDITEEKHSPGQLLLALVINRAHDSGIHTIDFTMGTEEYKARFGDECLSLPSVYIFPTKSSYLAFNLRTRVGLLGKRLAKQRWQKTEPLFRSYVERASRIRKAGFSATAAKLMRHAASAIGGRTTGLVFVSTPDRPAAIDGATDDWEFHENEIRDLAKWEHLSDREQAEVARTVNSVAEARAKGHTLHTVLIMGCLAGWGWSYSPTESALLVETQTRLEFAPGAVSLYDYYILERFRGRGVYSKLLAGIVQSRFNSGASKAYIMCLAANVASRKGIERAGFRLWRTDRCWKIFKWKRIEVISESSETS